MAEERAPKGYVACPRSYMASEGMKTEPELRTRFTAYLGEVGKKGQHWLELGSITWQYFPSSIPFPQSCDMLTGIANKGGFCG